MSNDKPVGVPVRHQRTAETQFCRHCGASIPHRAGEGRCPECVSHRPPSEPVPPWEKSRLSADHNLLPCPFCGDTDLENSPWPSGEGWAVSCGNPSCSVRMEDWTKDDIIQRWNRRVSK